MSSEQVASILGTLILVLLTLAVGILAHFTWDTRRQLREFLRGGNGIHKQRIPGTDRWLLDAHDYIGLRNLHSDGLARVDRLEQIVERRFGDLPSVFPFVDARRKELQEEFARAEKR